jgi:hypothetical protein
MKFPKSSSVLRRGLTIPMSPSGDALTCIEGRGIARINKEPAPTLTSVQASLRMEPLTTTTPSNF